MDEKTLNIFLKFALDANAAGRVKSGVTSIENELDRLQRTSVETKQALNEISEGAKRLGQNFTKAFAVGSAITGGIFAFAENYVRNAKDATATTKEWAEQNERLTRSKNRIGEVVAKEALPTLKAAADLTEKIAGFIERNPDIVNAALKGGMIIATVGAIGKLVTTGVKLHADAKAIMVGAKQIVAGRLMIEAANKQLAAAAASKLSGGQIAQGLRGTFGLGTVGAGGAASAGVLLPIVATVVSLVAGSYLGTKLGNAGGKAIYGDEWKDKGFAESMKEVWKTTRQIAMLASPITLVAAAFEKLGIISKETQSKIWELMKSIAGLGDEAKAGKGAGAKVGDPSGALVRVTDEQRQIVDAYVKMLEEEKQATQQYASDRLRIMQDSNSQISSLFRSNTTAVTRIVEDYNKQVQNITESYQKANAQAEANYQRQRAQAIESAGEEIRRIEEDHQERLRKLLQEHNDRVTDLVSSRDALGLVREMRDFERKRSEEVENTNKEIARRRADLAQTLRDMEAQHAAERAQRLADYKLQLKEAEAQKKEQLKLQAEQFHEQLTQAHKARQDALRQLAEQYQDERERRRAAFVAQVNDLDNAMQNEQQRKQTWYTAMLKDVDAFMAAWRDKMNAQPGAKSGTGAFPIKDQGGYATKGVYGLAQDGRAEFVLSGQTTKTAEALIGTKLTQDNLLAAMRNSGRSVVWNDHRRFDSRLSLADRREIQRDTMDLLSGALS